MILSLTSSFEFLPSTKIEFLRLDFCISFVVVVPFFVSFSVIDFRLRLDSFITPTLPVIAVLVPVIF